MSEQQLLPCPFCGGEAIFHKTPTSKWCVECQLCPVAIPIPTHSKESAAEYWNTRTQQGEAVGTVTPPELYGKNFVRWHTPDQVPVGTKLYTEAPPAKVPEAHNIKFVDRSSDFSVKVNFASCRAATEFEKFIKAQQGATE